MKKIMFSVLMSVLAACSASDDNSSSVVKDSPVNGLVAGKSYCRMISGFENCVRFAADGWNVTDNGSSFFGNPPESGTYVVWGRIITLSLRSVTDSYSTSYTLSSDLQTITGEGGAVLRLATEAGLAGKEYCRTMTTGGFLGQPEREFEHCISFVDEQNVVDNGSSYFGNPPESGTYRLDGQTITLMLTSVTGSYDEMYELSLDGRTIVGEAGAVLDLRN